MHILNFGQSEESIGFLYGNTQIKNRVRKIT